MFNPHLLLALEYRFETDKETGIYHVLNDAILYGYCLLKFRHDKYILICEDIDAGYIIPTKDKDFLFVDFDDALDYRKEIADNNWKEDYGTTYQIVRSNRNIASNLIYITETDNEESEDEKYVLYDNFCFQLLPKVYDEIELYDYFIVAKDGDDYEIYNLFLEPLYTKNVR